MDQDFILPPENINTEQIMREIHQSLTTRGYPPEVLKQLETSFSPEAFLVSSPKDLLSAYSQVGYWWELKPQPGFIGAVKAFVQKVVRKFTFFYFRHTFEQQNLFNRAALETIQELQDSLAKVKSAYEKLEEQQKRQELPFWFYEKFEAIHRGTREELSKRQEKYLPYFKGADDILDFGCGRGEFLELLRASGISCMGVDLLSENVKICRAKGFPVTEGDGLAYLEALPDESLGGIFCAQVAEHLLPGDIVRFFSLAFQKLRLGGVLILETLNPLCLKIFAESLYLDLSHQKPLHPLTAKFLAEETGFSQCKLLYFTPTPECKLIPADSSLECVSGTSCANALLFGDREYALYAVKEKPL